MYFNEDSGNTTNLLETRKYVAYTLFATIQLSLIDVIESL